MIKGSKHSNKTKLKISQAHKGLKHLDETKQKIGETHRGYKHSDSAKQKISKANKGRHFSLAIREKMSKAQISRHQNSHSPKGAKSYGWKGGKSQSTDGRMLVMKPKHPYAQKSGYVRRSRLVMEQIVGRYLKPNEQVHHNNGIANDDRPENLTLFPNFFAHMKFHKSKKCLESVSF